jgi:hypothetical protein
MIFFQYFWQDNHDTEIKQPRSGDLELNVRPNPYSIPKIDSLIRRGGFIVEARTDDWVNIFKNIFQSGICPS